MCGIVGILGHGDVAGQIIDSLRRLEYRGYDSAGIATLEQGRLDRRRAQGKLNNLNEILVQSPLRGQIGIGHTRWATHGAATTRNAHPHVSGPVAVVHNGIIENFRELRAELAKEGVEFVTDTDTETIAHLLALELKKGLSPRLAMQEVLARLHGAYALAILFEGHEDLMIGACNGPPLAVGYGEGEMYLGSDAIALASFSNRLTYLHDGDWVVLSRNSAEFFNSDNERVEREIQVIEQSAMLVGKGNHRHFMLKEIYEQPEVISHTLANYVNLAEGVVKPQDIEWTDIDRISMSACGTAYYACLVGKYWFETLAGLSVEMDVASEFRYRDVPLPEKGLAIFVSQSGETADTLASLRYCRKNGQTIASIINATGSTIARESDLKLPIYAGPEIGVASTKAFTCQLTVLACLALDAARACGRMDDATMRRKVQELVNLPRLILDMMELESQIKALAVELGKYHDVLYLGRGVSYPVALEGALKLKEISYIHAEGYAAGELKHGPIALIDEEVPVIVVAPDDGLYEKTLSNMQEVQARGGRIILISTARRCAENAEHVWGSITIPDTDMLLNPMICALPVQLLAYHTAVHMGTDVDQPRNLAKSVTVE